MGTQMADVISNYAMVEIDDVRLRQQAQENAALFFRRMALYMNAALPLFNRPPEMREYLINGMVEPSFDNSEWVSTQESTTQSTTVSTGLTGFTLFSCSLVTYDGAGNAVLTPYTEASYNAESGEVTFPEQADAGLIYTMDFYTDGQFSMELTLAQKRILGLCIANVWQERFSENWLNMQPKIKDKSFETGSEHAHITANTGRLKEMRASLSAELMKYEQDCEYYAQVQAPERLQAFV